MKKLATLRLRQKHELTFLVFLFFTIYSTFGRLVFPFLRCTGQTGQTVHYEIII